MIRRLSIVVFLFAVSMMIGTFVIDTVSPLWEPLPILFWTTIGSLVLANLLIPFLALRLARRAEARADHARKVKQRILWGGALGAPISVLEMTQVDSKR